MSTACDVAGLAAISAAGFVVAVWLELLVVGVACLVPSGRPAQMIAGESEIIFEPRRILEVRPQGCRRRDGGHNSSGSLNKNTDLDHRTCHVCPVNGHSEFC